MPSRPWLLSFLLAALAPGASLIAASPFGCLSRPAAPIWNLPPLIGQPIDTATQTLGRPTNQSTASPGILQGEWKRDDITLTARWKSSSGRVISYDLVSREDSSALRDGETGPLLLPGQLKQGDPRYSLEWIEARDRPLFYVGVKVVPAPKTHTVILRVTGPEALIQIAYRAGASTETIDTIPSWEKTLTLPDDATVELSASVLRTLGRPLSPMKTEILVDGKVVASSTATASAAQSRYEL